MLCKQSIVRSARRVVSDQLPNMKDKKIPEKGKKNLRRPRRWQAGVGEQAEVACKVSKKAVHHVVTGWQLKLTSLGVGVRVEGFAHTVALLSLFLCVGFSCVQQGVCCA